MKMWTYNPANFYHEVFVISRIIKVEVGVTSQSRSRRLRLLTLTETFIGLDIIIVFLYTERKKVMYLLPFTDGKQHKARELST